MTTAAVALGSNLGDRVAHLRDGVDGIRALGTIVSSSPLYETAPVGGPEQGAYLNAVVVVETELPPHDLLEELHRIERDADRIRGERWGPRTLDLDLIIYGDVVIDPPAGRGLQLPHPRYRERRFVLEPLLAAWPSVVDPTGADLGEALRAVEDQKLVEFDDSGWAGVVTRDRGGAWVAGQTALLIGLAVALAATGGAFSSAAVHWLGRFMVLAGIGLGLAGAISLGQNLTPYPEPIAEGELVTTGSYRLVRHPLYGATVLIALGASLWVGSVVGALLSIAAVGFYVGKARSEETRLLATYPGYEEYMADVRARLIPWVI